MTNNMDKQTMRLAFKARRQAMSEGECNERGQALCERIMASEAYKKAHTIMAYLAMPKEANLDRLIEKALAAGKKVYVPVCVSKTEMIAAELKSLEAITLGVLRIRIPAEPYECIAPTDLDLILVPGVAFDVAGGRMGMGAGYYDRFLADVSAERCVGVAWDTQVVSESIPMDVHDKRLGALITDKQSLQFK